MRRLQFLVIGAIAAATGMALPYDAGAQTIIDNKGKTVGTFYGRLGDVDLALRRIGPSISVYFPVARGGLLNSGGSLQYEYTSIDCTGPAYFSDDVNTLTTRGYLIPPSKDDRWSTKGVLVYAGEPRAKLSIYSARSKFNYNIGDGPCTQVEPSLKDVRPVVQQDVSSWRLTAPFKIK